MELSRVTPAPATSSDSPADVLHDEVVDTKTASSDSPRQLDVENSTLTTDCAICFENKKNTLQPCGHSVLCESCATSTVQSSAQCPICRERFLKFWVSETFTQEKNFIHDVDQKKYSGLKVVKRTEPLPSPALNMAALTMLGLEPLPASVTTTNNRHARRIPCKQITCWYLFAFAVSIILVFAGAVTTNWECEKRTCLCASTIRSTTVQSPLENGTSSAIRVDCNLVCSCMTLESNPVSTVDVFWQEPRDSGNSISSQVCPNLLSPTPESNWGWKDLCAAVKETKGYVQGDCLSSPESQVPCGGPGFSYYIFTVGWYTIILLTNLLMFLCFCYCFGVCRSGA